MQFKPEEVRYCKVCSSVDIKRDVLTRIFYVQAFRESVTIKFSICNRCSFIFQSNPMDRSLVDYYYSNNNQPRDTKSNKIELDVHRKQSMFISDEVKINGKTVMEIGSSAGKFLNFLKKEYQCITYFDELNGDAKYLLEKNGHQYCNNHSKCFDFIVMRHVLEHVIDPWDYLVSLRERLGRKSILFIEVPDWSRMDSNTDTLNFEHVSHFTPLTLNFLLDHAGYFVLKQEIDRTKNYSTTPNRVLRVLVQIKARKILNDVTNAFVTHANESECKLYSTLEKIAGNYPKDACIGLYAASWLCQDVLKNTNIAARHTNLRIFDKDKRKQKREFHGFKVEPPEAILKNPPQLIFLLSSYEYEIKKELRAFGYTGTLIPYSELLNRLE